MSTNTSSRPPLLQWSKQTWSRWALQPRLTTNPIPRTKFLLLKAPASTLYEEKYGGDRNVFTVPMYASRMMAKGLSVGLVVDCTALDILSFDGTDSTADGSGNPVRYFHNVNEWEDFAVDYYRVSPSTKKNYNNIPSKETIKEFTSLCHEQFQSNPTLYIAIFDSRGGIGAASFLACCYMCEMLRAPVHAALASVQSVMKSHNISTGCGLGDIELVKELQRLYKGRREITFDLGGLPEWWFAVDDDDDDEEDKEDKDKEGKSGTGKKEKSAIVIPPFQEGEKQIQNPNRKRGITDVANNTAGTSTATSDIKRRISAIDNNESIPIHALQVLHSDSPRYTRALTVLQQLTSFFKGNTNNVDGNNSNISSLPICPEATLTPENLSKIIPLASLSNKKFKVTWGSIGRRGFLLVLSDGIYFIEKQSLPNNNKIQISLLKGSTMNFPNPQNPSTQQHRTLLDGILLHDRESPTKLVPRYMATDILAHMGGILTSKPFVQRYSYLMNGVIKVRKKHPGASGKVEEIIKLRAKEYFDVTTANFMNKVKFVMEDVCQGVLHDTNGIVMVNLDGGYYDQSRIVWNSRKDDDQSYEYLEKNALLDYLSNAMS